MVSLGFAIFTSKVVRSFQWGACEIIEYFRSSFRPSWRDPRFREEARAGIQEISQSLDSRLRGNDE
jgi:hypothetical protein